MSRPESPNFRSTLTRTLFFILLSGLSYASIAQKSMRDSSLSFAMLSPSYTLMIPSADLNARFGVFSGIGADLSYKFKSNFILFGNLSFLFGNRVKETSMLDYLKNEEGQILDVNGRIGDLIFEQRGLYGHIDLSRNIVKLGPNPNCGLYFGLGFGFLQHRIKVRELAGNFPAIDAEYNKGYDRLSSGPLMNQSLYYRFFSNDRILNFYFGIEAFQAFTNGRRSYQFDTKMPYNESRVDLAYGLRAGWTFPIYKRAPRQFYYE